MKNSTKIIMAVVSAVFVHMGFVFAEPSMTESTASVDAVDSMTVTKVLEKMEYLRGFKDSAFNFTAEVAMVEDKAVAERHVLDVKISDKGYALVDVLSPNNQRGQRTLLRDHDLWLFLPRTSNIIRIAPLQRVFGSASIADLLNVSFLHGFTVTSSNKTDDGGRLGLSLRSNDPFSTYARIDVDFDLSSGLPIETRHYATSDRLLKTIQYKTFQSIDGNPKVEKIVIYDEVRKSSAIWIKMSAYEKASYPDTMFTKAALPN